MRVFNVKLLIMVIVMLVYSGLVNSIKGIRLMM